MSAMAPTLVPKAYTLSKRKVGTKRSFTENGAMPMNCRRDYAITLEGAATKALNSDSASSTDASSVFAQQWATYLDDDEYDSIGDDDEDDVDHEEESRVARALANALFTKRMSCAAISQLLEPPCTTPVPAKKKIKTDFLISVQSPHSSVYKMRMVASAPVLNGMAKYATDASFSATQSTKPDDLLRSILTKSGKLYRPTPAETIPGYFDAITADEMDAYDLETVRAARELNVNRLRQLHQSGKTMRCGNKFGERLLHIACRRNCTVLVDFLLHEAAVSCKVVCDNGRTPLHDACWSTQPNFAVIDLLLDACPDLLHVSDKRGFPPLAYVRAEHWQLWCDYLRAQPVERLRARELV